MDNQMSSAVVMLKVHQALEQGDLSTAQAGLRKVVSYGEAINAGFLSWLNPRIVNEIFDWGLSADIDSECINKILKTYQSRPDETMKHEKSSVVEVKICTLGKFSLEVDGNPLSFSGKAHKKPIELLKAIVALGRHPVSKEHLAELLWPDVDGDMALNSLRTTLHRLRKLVGSATVILHDGKISLNTKHCSVDAWGVENLIKDLEELVCIKGASNNPPNKNTIMKQLYEVIDLYKGHFLNNDHDHAWLLSLRERLRGRIVNILNLCARYLFGVNQYQLSLECYQKGLLIDDKAEAFYQGSMNCYLLLGNYSEGLVAYESCKRILGQSLGIQPSPETRRIYNFLRLC